MNKLLGAILVVLLAGLSGCMMFGHGMMGGGCHGMSGHAGHGNHAASDSTHRSTPVDSTHAAEAAPPAHH